MINILNPAASHGIYRVGREGCGQAESKDRMVPVRSAALGFWAEDTTVYQAQEHNALLKTAATITFISRMIADNISNSFINKLHVFGSGEDIAKNQAQAFAQNNGGITINMTRLGKYLESIPNNVKLWQYASPNFANQVGHGDTVRAILYYPAMSKTAIWYSELNILAEKYVEIIIGAL